MNRVHEILGVRIAAADRLRTAILQDLSSTSHGIEWWMKSGDTQRRILVSDQLMAASASITTNLTEAVLHQWEHKSAWELVERRYARVCKPDGTLNFPEFATAADLVPELVSTMHVAGFFRALGSALDCLAATTIGVAAIPQDILKADFAGIHAWLRGERNKADLRHSIHTALLDRIDDAARQAGPPGWLEWMFAYRNMIVHRGRRTELRAMKVDAQILDAAGKPVPRTTPIAVLLREPGVSNVAAFVRLRMEQLTLSENADVTLTECVRSCVYLARTILGFLLDVWVQRRQDPEQLLQPLDRQWPEVSTQTQIAFDGYAPGTVHVDFDKAINNDVDVRRLEAAALRASDVDSIWGQPDDKSPDSA